MGDAAIALLKFSKTTTENLSTAVATKTKLNALIAHFLWNFEIKIPNDIGFFGIMA